MCLTKVGTPGINQTTPESYPPRGPGEGPACLVSQPTGPAGCNVNARLNLTSQTSTRISINLVTEGRFYPLTGSCPNHRDILEHQQPCLFEWLDYRHRSLTHGGLHSLSISGCLRFYTAVSKCILFYVFQCVQSTISTPGTYYLESLYYVTFVSERRTALTV